MAHQPTQKSKWLSHWTTWQPTKWSSGNTVNGWTAEPEEPNELTCKPNDQLVVAAQKKWCSGANACLVDICLLQHEMSVPLFSAGSTCQCFDFHLLLLFTTISVWDAKLCFLFPSKHTTLIILNSKEWLIYSKLLELFLRLVLWK